MWKYNKTTVMCFMVLYLMYASYPIACEIGETIGGWIRRQREIRIRKAVQREFEMICKRAAQK